MLNLFSFGSAGRRKTMLRKESAFVLLVVMAAIPMPSEIWNHQYLSIMLIFVSQMIY